MRQLKNVAQAGSSGYVAVQGFHRVDAPVTCSRRIGGYFDALFGVRRRGIERPLTLIPSASRHLAF